MNHLNESSLNPLIKSSAEVSYQLPLIKAVDYLSGNYNITTCTLRINLIEPHVKINNSRTINNNFLLTNEADKQSVKMGYYDEATKRYYLDNEVFENVFFSAREIEVFKRLLLGYTAKQTGELLKISPKTVEDYISNIKLKLQAKSKREIIATAIQFGLTHIIHLKTNP
jgi:DNA-binding CsgD family transcriptional regulator